VRAFLRGFWTGLRRSLLLLITLTMLGGSSLLIVDQADRIGFLTRPVQFDFIGWTIGALLEKTGSASVAVPDYLEPDGGPTLVLAYLSQLGQLQQARAELENAFGQPGLEDRDQRLQALSEQVAVLADQVAALQPLAESVLQSEAEQILRDMGFGEAGAILPPLIFTMAPLPSALIVSPRDEIRQEANVNLRLDLNLEGITELEQAVEASTGTSALVVPVGGLGTYPTMVQEHTSLVWVTEVIGHEWVHNYLSLRPLGLLYSQSPELRTMNETTASLMGLAIGREILKQFYPELVPPEARPDAPQSEPAAEPVFDFRAEMRRTRVTVDQMLEIGQIEEAEAYMEARRVFFWENGYHIRRLNQAYFAFHGAYAEEPGGAAGDDPVGEAVRLLWQWAASPHAFLQQMARMRQVQDLWDATGFAATTR
jgi:hypothetical protein